MCLPPARWPDRLSAVSGPQQWVQRHTVEQMGDCMPGLPVLDAPVPQVEHLVGVLMMPVTEVPKLAQEDGAALRAVLREPRVAEQLVDVPVPHTVILADGRDDRGIRWRHVLGRRGGACWWMVGTNHTKKDRPQGLTASPGRHLNTGQGGLPSGWRPCDHAAQVPAVRGRHPDPGS